MSEKLNADLKKPQYPAIRNIRWGFNILAIFFIVFLMGYSWLSLQGVKKDQSKELSSIAELSGNSLDSYFAHYEHSFKVLSQELLDEHGSISVTHSHLVLKRFLQANPDLLIANVNRPDGQIVVSSEVLPGLPLPSQANAQSFILGRDELLKGGDFEIGRATYGPLAKGWVIPLRYAIRDKKRKLLYILVAVLPLSRQQSFWRDLSLPDNTALGLLRDDAYLISRYPDAVKTGLDELYGKPRKGILVEHLNQHAFPPRGNIEGYNSAAKEDFLFNFRRLSHYPVTLFVATPISNVYGKWWQQVQLTYLLLLLFILGSYAVYRWTTKNQLAWELEREQQEEKLHSIYDGLLESEERFRRVADEAPFPMMIHAEDGEVLEINKAWSEATGYTPADIPTIASWLKHAYGENVQEVREIVERVYGISQKIDQGEFVIRCKDGSTRTWHFSASPVGKLPDGRRYVVSMAQDISERKAAQQQIEFLAYHDALTGLPNRLLAKDHLEQAILVAEREKTRVALLFIDLDKFKTINDSLGHVIGDELLKGVALRLRECLRDTDTLSRQGGDEFLIVLNEVRDTESITTVVEKILARVAEPFEIEHHELSISLSIGIAVYPDDGRDFDTLLKQSDTAMYQAKEAGRNTYRFHTAQMNVDAIEHLRMRNGLRRALEHGEFVLHYQPQISLASGAVIGAEALIRWNHPELGMVPPGRFIPIAEDSGLIVPIGEWVLREACRQAVAWRNAGLPELLIAVNLSAVQFKRGDVEKSVTQALGESGLNPALLELELTESILIKDTEKVLAAVQQLKSLGVKLSIDDFGTGYSSLSYLKRFNVDKLKIDQSFVRDMADDPNDAAIVHAIIQMAKSLNLTTIAEGVEDERQLALLRSQLCDEVQGYHFARPMPADEFANFLSGHRSSTAE
jgi:diguanylate cyclase (GGDEF)-like protein/PAS domain S-box-containing protein